MPPKKSTQSASAKPEAPVIPKRGRGRPRLQANVLLNERFQVRLSSEELRFVTEMGGSRWVRELLSRAADAQRGRKDENASGDASPDYAAAPAARLPEGITPEEVQAAREAAGVAPIAESGETLPFAAMGVPCGFPYDADDACVEPMDLSSFLVRHPDMSYVVTAVGDSMVDAGIYEGDRLVIDRQIQPNHNDIVMAYLNGTFTIKRYVRDDNKEKIYLCPDNALANYPVIEVSKQDNFYVEGVVVSVMRRLRR